LNLINPHFAIQNEDNIFTIRKRDYSDILGVVSQILQPVHNIGFQIEELGLKDSRFISGEIARTLKQTLVIRLKKGTSVVDLSMFIPKLIDDNYIFINGRKKIPLFQLFDIPVVTRGESVKLRTNVATIMALKDREFPFVKMSFLGKKVPMASMIFAYFGVNQTIQKFNLTAPRQKIDHPSATLYELLLHDLYEMMEESRGWSQDDFILEIGRIYSKYTAKSKGEDVLYALELIPQVDIMTRQFLNQNNLLDELVETFKVGFIDDTSFLNKRVRCFEYILYGVVAKNVFDLCFSNRDKREPKFNINSNQIITACNVSDIVQFDFSINPIEQLTKLSRISLLGPGGFKRENIPRHLRDICPTMYGRICPVDTPDRDNCGVLQNLLPNVDLDDHLKFTRNTLDHAPISIPVSMVPFCEHDDQTRLQMSSSQMRQSIMLKKFERPIISSGCEGLYTKYTQSTKVAKQDGVVIHADEKYIIVHYEDGTIDIFDISYRKIYVENMEFFKIYVKEGDKITKGEILAESNYCQDGNITFGKNLLTGVMVHYGNNYEDGIVISDRLVKENVLTSIHYRDLSFHIPPHKVLLSLSEEKYKPLPDRLEIVEIGEPYAILKNLNTDDFYSVFQEEKKFEAEKRFIISEINLYANEWNTEIPEYKQWIEERITQQRDKENYINKIIRSKLDKSDADKFIKENGLDMFSHVGKYKVKKEKIDGIKVEMFGIHFRNIRVGDKLGNRHGNKGVISRIEYQEKMPQLPDGRHLDICINPLGIISRMNIGQLYELHLSMSVMDLKNVLKDMLKTSHTQDEVKEYLMEYVKTIDKTKDGWLSEQFESQLPDIIDEEFIDSIAFIQPPFESVRFEDLEEAMSLSGTQFKQRVYDPIAKRELENPIAVGYQYFFRMVHIAEAKLAARGIGSYAKRTLQPLGGRKNKGGQRCGEMETACIIGHDAPINLHEFLTTKSDCIDLKNKYISDLISFNPIDGDKNLDATPESVKLLNSYLTILGVDYK
jgi:DNA-directed RNA polymerase beta subunit